MAKLLTSVPVGKRFDIRVMWREGYCPTAYPVPSDTVGTVFLSKGHITFVTWDGSTRPVGIATKALQAI